MWNLVDVLILNEILYKSNDKSIKSSTTQQ